MEKKTDMEWLEGIQKMAAGCLAAFMLLVLFMQPADATRTMLNDCMAVNMSTINATRYIYDCQVPEIPVVMNASCSMTGYEQILMEYINTKSTLAVCKNELNLTKIEISKVSGILSSSESIGPAIAGLNSFIVNYSSCQKSTFECERQRDTAIISGDQCKKELTASATQLMMTSANLTSLNNLLSANLTSLNSLTSAQASSIYQCQADSKKASDGQVLFGVVGAGGMYLYYKDRKKKELGAKATDKSPFAGINLKVK